MATRKRNNFKTLAAEVRRDPARSARVDEYKRAIEDTLGLADLRDGRGQTQVRVAERLGTSQANVSRIERQRDLYVSTLSGYVEALGGHLEVKAVFDDHTVELIGSESDADSTQGAT